MTAEDRIAELEQRLGKVEDLLAIRNLQHAYGYYLDKCLYDEVVDLFAEAGEVRFMGGVFRGKAGLRRLYCDRFRKNFTAGVNGPVYGFLLDHPGIRDGAGHRGARLTLSGRRTSPSSRSPAPGSGWRR